MGGEWNGNASVVPAAVVDMARPCGVCIAMLHQADPYLFKIAKSIPISVNKGLVCDRFHCPTTRRLVYAPTDEDIDKYV